ncbi:MAG: NADH-quinone oxidoreductase subunit NuoF [Deltaproteobacteria bacterium]|nr:NADH-quinone oxidoreductase subunit NuoF [Deltaproteobacteria bacterium]
MSLPPTVANAAPGRGHLLRLAPGESVVTLDRHLALGGFSAVRKALVMGPQAVADEVRRANLRGRGGAGFPAGVKWGFLPKDSPKPRYLVINADEGEPGTFKDRYFLERDPFPMLEGMIVSAYAIGAKTAYLYVRGEFVKPIAMLERAVEQLHRGGYLGKSVLGSSFGLDIHVHPGAGAYVCGEESALLESLEGKPGRPRNKPPFPAVVGLFGCPTIINNVETMACVRLIADVGAERFVAMGLPKDGGPKIYGLSGHVKRPGLYEAPMGTPLRKLVYDFGGGTIDDRPIKGIIPGGSSTPVLGSEHLDVAMDFDSVKAAGSMLGTGAVTVFTEGTCAVRLLTRLAAFYAHESCGQCTPCRDGTGWMERVVSAIEEGRGRPGDCDLLLSIANQIMGNTICALGDAAAMPVIAFVERYRAEFEEHVARGGCPFEGGHGHGHGHGHEGGNP